MAKAWVATAVAGAMLAAPVQAGCWNGDDASAATVRELQSMLMVAALRCQVSGHAMLSEYNGFVTANRATIAAMNDRLKAHFIHAAGPVEGQRAYDRFTTSMANGYGAGASGSDSCGAAASLAREAALMAGSAEGLAMLADREGLVAKLPEGVCGEASPVTIASAAPVVAPAYTELVSNVRQ